MRLRDIRFAPAARDLRRKGLLGFVSCSLNGEFYFDGLTLRRTVEGTYCLGFPSHTDKNGVEHSYYRPLSNGVRDAVEAQVIAALRRGAHIL